MITVEECKSEIQNLLSHKRYFHSLCVAEKSIELAKKYGADPVKAEIAGILHDIQKEALPKDQLALMQGSNFEIFETEWKSERLWHPISGAIYAKKVLHVDDPEIIAAIRSHTSGHKDMTLLEKVIFVADFVSDDREYPGVKKLREAAKSSLEQVVVEGIEYTVKELMEKRDLICSSMIDAYNDAILALMK